MNYFFPLIRATKDGKYYRYEELIATVFFIGSRGYALTAGHVIDQLFGNLPGSGVVLALFSDEDSYWHPYEVVKKERHPEENLEYLINSKKALIEMSALQKTGL